MNFQSFKKDFAERFLNFETLKGIYMLPAGFAVLYLTWHYQQYTYQAVLSLLGLYLIHEGLRKIFVNRIKQEASKRKKIEERVGHEHSV